MRIGPKHPVRAAICNLTTYWPNKAKLIDGVVKECRKHGLEAEYQDMSGVEGQLFLKLRPENNASVICDVCAEEHDNEVFDNWVVVSYYTMESGSVELVSYIS
jgi:hypothetical protein